MGWGEGCFIIISLFFIFWWHLEACGILFPWPGREWWDGEKAALLLLVYFLSFGGTLKLVGSYFPNQELDPGPLHWKCGVLTTGPPGKFLKGCCFRWGHQESFLPRERLSWVLKDERAVGLWKLGWRVFQAEGLACARALRQKWTCCVQGPERRPACLDTVGSGGPWGLWSAMTSGRSLGPLSSSWTVVKN